MNSFWITRRLRLWSIGGLATLLLAAPATAVVTVQTLGGGPRQGNPSAAGYTDGDTALYSQFDGPSGIAFDSTGNNLFVADRTNNAVRKLDLAGNRTSTFTAVDVAQPVDVALDQSDNVYVLNESNGPDGFISKFNKYGNSYGLFVTGLSYPTALTIDANTNLYVTELNGTIKRVTPTGAVTNLARVNQPGVELKGIVLTDDGNLVVSDAGNNALWSIQLISGAVTLFTGGHSAGDTFGEAPFVQFNRPEHLARAGNNMIVVADRGNHKVKLVDSFGTVTPIYGVSSNLWVVVPGSPEVFPGWWDGEACQDMGCAEAREPVGVAVSPAGEVYATEHYYHLIRKATGAELTGPGMPPTAPLFTGPAGLAMDSTGSFVFIADQANNAVRRLELDANRTLTFATANLNQPVALVLDATDNVYVLNQASGTIVKFNRFANPLPWTASGLSQPTAMAIGESTNLYVTELSGAIKRADTTGHVSLIGTVAEPGVQLQGIALMDDGTLAVSDSGNQAIWLVDAADGTHTLLTGHNGTGATEGTSAFAQFNGPRHIAKAGGDLLVVADANNHRLAVVDSSGTVTNLVVDNSVVFYGRAGDPVQPNDSRFVPLTDPLGVLVAPKGDVFSTEHTAGVLRWTKASGLTGPQQSTNDMTLPAPVITPDSGYYPMGQIIAVSSPNPVYYTTDGTDPTTNSLSVPLNGSTGSIFWNDSLHDLTWLRLRAIGSTNASEIVTGMRPNLNQIGVSSDVAAGAGSTVLIPVVLNLRSNVVVRSIQFRLEFAPLDGAPPVYPQAINIQTNDFVPVTSTTVPNQVGHYTAGTYDIPNPANLATTIPGGVSVYILGPDANLEAHDYGAVSMMAVSIDPSAQVGQRYRIDLVQASATSDGQQISVPLATMTTHFITITNLSYLVGDTSPGLWYNAGGFGDGDLNNNDVNDAFYAALGVRVPRSDTDVFDAMDVYPPDHLNFVGGDGQIRFLDWQYILLRSLRLDTNNWLRFWSNGVRANQYLGTNVPTLNAGVQTKTKSSSPGLPGAVWNRQATLSSQDVHPVSPGATIEMPVTVRVAAGAALAGLSFRAVVTGTTGAPQVEIVDFQPGLGLPRPVTSHGSHSNEVLCGWPIVPQSAFAASLQGSNQVGYLRFRIPSTAQAGQSYTLNFRNPDGAPDLQTQYELESIPATAWVSAAPARPTQLVSEEWRNAFFGSFDNPAGADTADPDGDAVPNWMEYQAGTNPTNAASRLRLLADTAPSSPAALSLHWLSAPGKRYVIESATNLATGPWTTIAGGIEGNGDWRSLSVGLPTNVTCFYRIRIEP